MNTIMKVLFALLILVIVLAVAGYFVLKTYVLPNVVNQYVNSSQVQAAANSLQITQFQDANPLTNSTTEIPASP